MFPNRTSETEPFWNAYDGVWDNGWAPPFKVCNFLDDVWFYSYVLKKPDAGVGLFIAMQLNQCDSSIAEVFGGPHRCDHDSTMVSDLKLHFNKYKRNNRLGRRN